MPWDGGNESKGNSTVKCFMLVIRVVDSSKRRFKLETQRKLPKVNERLGQQLLTTAAAAAATQALDWGVAAAAG